MGIPMISQHTCTDGTAALGERRRVRAAAEIETVMVIPILITLLLLAVGLFRLGAARIANTAEAEKQAYGQVIAGRSMMPSTSITPVEGFGELRPGLPTRFDEAVVRTGVTLGNPLSTMVRLSDQAVFLDPVWTYSGYPNQGDAGDLDPWFSPYAREGADDDLRFYLGMHGPWEP